MITEILDIIMEKKAIKSEHALGLALDIKPATIYWWRKRPGKNKITAEHVHKLALGAGVSMDEAWDIIRRPADELGKNS